MKNKASETKKKDSVYLPHERDYLEQPPQDIKSCSNTNKKSCTPLPDPVRDPIVSNNIAYQEFDYTAKDQP